MRQTTSWLTAAMFVLATPSAVHAFCGFYVSGADSGQGLYNNATMVLMMRDGTKTVLSMQNNYQGPPENFAMIVPVPVVLRKKHVKTLELDVFKRIDQLAAPRLVEYWEQDPCTTLRRLEEGLTDTRSVSMAQFAMKKDGLGVTVEAQFKVGEYEIVILSAKDSTGLDKWLELEGYNIPDNSEPLLRPYVEGGSKFFVAKVDVEKVKFDGDQVMLSPLRFHYDTDKFSLPVRLGLVNSAGTQDLIVHILAKGSRFEVANYDNVKIPTNIDVDDTVRNEFGAFYAALFDSTLEHNKGAVVTEYAWDASTCDPCPVPGLTRQELATLGGDVLPGDSHPSQFVLTRLHARYSKDSLGEDLVFKTAKPIAGGREWRTGPQGQLESGAVDSHANMFQARYAIRHEWTGAIECSDPIRGRWGGPPPDLKRDSRPRAAMDLAFARRGGMRLSTLVKQDIPELGIKRAAAAAAAAPANNKAAAGDDKRPTKKAKGGCGCRAGGDAPGGLLAALLVLVALRRRCKR